MEYLFKKTHKGKRIWVYEGGCVYWKMKARLTDITVEYLRNLCVEGFVYAYSRDTYMLAYEDAIQPMPGPKYWDKVQLREPHPPSLRVMPGRPKSKKRKLEKGESSSGPEQLKPKKHKQCRNCGQYGHYAKTCGNASVVIPPPPPIASSEPNKGGRPPLQTAWVNEQRKNKEKRAVTVQAEGAGPLSTANRKFPQETSQLPAQGQNCSQASSTISTKKQTTP